MAKSKVLVCGAGKIGQTIGVYLDQSGDFDVVIADVSSEALRRLEKHNLKGVKVDMSDQSALESAAQGVDFIVSALPFQFTVNVATTAKNVGAHYVDLTEDVKASEIVKDLAKGANSSFVPQSGLAPGFISIAAHYLAQKFDKLEDLKMRVGALTKYPNNAIKYNLTWSTAGLINEYCHPCNAIVDGELKQVEALQGYEHFTLDGTNYEAFNTSGGLGTLCDTLAGKVRNLDYKSIRYPGHLDVMRFLINDLKMKDNQEMLVEILDNAIPGTKQDVVLIYITATGEQNGRFMQETYVTKVYAGEIYGLLCSGIQITTAGAACAVVDLIREGKISTKGFVKQEDINFEDFINNRFGRFYAPGEETASDV